MTIELSIHCYNYQHRLNWLLCSILQQIGDLPDIYISVSYLPNTGNPTTEKVLDFFEEKGLNIIRVPLEKGQESDRSVSRNIRLRETKVDWMLFADCDLVYDKLFFDDLKKKLQIEPYSKAEVVMGADRYSLDIPFCIKYFEEDKREYPCIIENVADITSGWKVGKFGGGGIAAGYFQLVSMEVVRRKNVIYSGGKKDVWRRTRSDREFRVRMGGRMAIPVKPMYHLNHSRDDSFMQR